MDVVAALLSLRDGVVPATAHTSEVPDEYGIDLVTGGPRQRPLTHALVLARGRWGFNSAVVVSSAAKLSRRSPPPAGAPAPRIPSAIRPDTRGGEPVP